MSKLPHEEFKRVFYDYDGAYGGYVAARFGPQDPIGIDRRFEQWQRLRRYILAATGMPEEKLDEYDRVRFAHLSAHFKDATDAKKARLHKEWASVRYSIFVMLYPELHPPAAQVAEHCRIEQEVKDLKGARPAEVGETMEFGRNKEGSFARVMHAKQALYDLYDSLLDDMIEYVTRREKLGSHYAQERFIRLHDALPSEDELVELVESLEYHARQSALNPSRPEKLERLAQAKQQLIDRVLRHDVATQVRQLEELVAELVLARQRVDDAREQLLEALEVQDGS